MNRICHPLAAAGIAMMLQAGFGLPVLAQGGPLPSQDAEAVPGPEGSSPAEIELGSELPVLYVTGVEVVRTVTEPRIDIVRVTGLAPSKGWSYPQLVPTATGMPLDGILDLELIAAAPAQSQEADGFVPVSAVLVLEPGDPFKGVRVRGSENVLQLNQIPGSNAQQISTNDCHDCVGKQFVAAGHAETGQGGVVREEDLPKGLRVLAPSSSIRGSDQSPNRLSLILSDTGTITEAFWE